MLSLRSSGAFHRTILIEKQCLSLEVNMFLDEGAFDNDDVDTGFNKMKVSNSSKLLQ